MAVPRERSGYTVRTAPLVSFGRAALVAAHKGPMLVNEIGRRIQLTSGSITTAIDRLEARGLVERSADAGDRRVKKVALTRSGRALITRIFDKHKADLDDAADGLTRAERETLIALLKKLGMTADASSV